MRSLSSLSVERGNSSSVSSRFSKRLTTRAALRMRASLIMRTSRIIRNATTAPDASASPSSTTADRTVWQSKSAGASTQFITQKGRTETKSIMNHVRM